ncbi:restriction endonuclease [Streptomyces sp. DSM 44917]|uniref:Restriction endonuclease n=1 Tax=Streptomyces boetiae TaxID=3075541 RepID=A0ABU2LEI4_9ACTN|nr:restriction endonuclease [Streptomyces sp. DSM 44917]MDT0309682.1 restriction endonuclease [Streptomyces sp. DSM 44917]
MTLLEDLKTLAGSERSRLSPQARGRHFEKWLQTLLSQENLSPKTSYRPDGEEVDGSFIRCGRVYLIEAKWWKDPVPASAIYQFKGKVDGKLSGTVGLFISMSGYSDDAVDALRVGKELNVVLFDRKDVYLAAEFGFARVLDFKLRVAAERGEVFMPYVAQGRVGDQLPTDTQWQDSLKLDGISLVVEGYRDQVIVEGIVEGLRARSIQVRKFRIIVARGRAGIPNIASALAEDDGGEVLVLADTDGGYGETHLAELGRKDHVSVVVVDPGVERWVGMTSRDEAKNHGFQELHHMACAIDVELLASHDEGFRSLIETLTSVD